MTVQWTVRTATGFSAEKRIPLSPPNKKTHRMVSLFIFVFSCKLLPTVLYFSQSKSSLPKGGKFYEKSHSDFR